MLRRTLPLTLVLVSLAGCAVGAITGEVDGDQVPAFRSGLVFDVEVSGSDDEIVAIAAFYTFTNACEIEAAHIEAKLEAFRDAKDGEDLDDVVDDVHDFEKEHLPDDYWAAYVMLAGDDEDDIQDDFEIDDDEDDAEFVICHHTGAVDVPQDDGTAALVPDVFGPFYEDDNRECFVAEEGDVQVDLYEEGKRIRLTAQLELVDDEDDDAGDIELEGVGAGCEETEDAMEELVDEATEANERDAQLE